MAMTKKEQAYVQQLETELFNEKQMVMMLKKQLLDRPESSIAYMTMSVGYDKVYIPEHSDIIIDLPDHRDEIRVRQHGRGIIVSSMHNTLATIPQAGNSVYITAGRDVFDMLKEPVCR